MSYMGYMGLGLGALARSSKSHVLGVEQGEGHFSGS